MGFDFKAALVYPYRAENRRDMIWTPGVFIYVFSIFIVVLLAVLGLIVYGSDSMRSMILDGMSRLPRDASETPQKLALDFLQSILQMIVNLVTGVLAYGYLWQLYGRWKTDGPQAGPVHWVDNWVAIIKDGLKIMLYFVATSLAIYLPLFIGIFLACFLLGWVLGFNQADSGTKLIAGLLVFLVVFILLIVAQVLISPFLYGPVAASAESRKLADLFNYKRGFMLAAQRYKPVLGAILLCIPVAIAYTVATLVIGFATCCIGFLLAPFIGFAQHVTMAHLIFQGFEGNLSTPEAPVLPPGNDPPPVEGGNF